MDTVCTIHLLGELRVQYHGRCIQRFRTQKASALLAYLAYYLHRSHSRDELIGMLWPEYSPERGRNCLSIELNSLRKLLEHSSTVKGAVLLSDRHSVRLNPALVKTDVGELKQYLEAADHNALTTERIRLLTQAADLYSNRLLPGLYEEWVTGEQMLLEDRVCAAIQQLYTLLIQSGDLSAAVHYARVIVRIDPLREEAHRQLIDLLLAKGDVASAARQQEVMHDLLRKAGFKPPEAVVRVRQSPQRSIKRSTSTKSGDARHSPPTSSFHAGTVTLTLLLIDLYVPASLEGANITRNVERKLGQSARAGQSEGADITSAISRSDSSLRNRIEAVYRIYGGPFWVMRSGILLGFTSATNALAAARSLLTAGVDPISSCLPGAITSLQMRLVLHTSEVDLSLVHELPADARLLEQIVTLMETGTLACTETTALLLKRRLPPDVSLLPLGNHDLTPGEEPETLFNIALPEMSDAPLERVLKY